MARATDKDATPRRSTPLAVKLLLLALGLILGVVAVELGLRTSWSAKGTPFSPEAAREEIEKAGAVLQAGLDPVPTSGTVRTPGDDDDGEDGASDGPGSGDGSNGAGSTGAGSNGAGSAGDGSAGGAHAATDPNGRSAFLHPYFGWDVGGPHSEYLEQRESFTKPRSKRSFDVVMLGGSVAANFGWTGARELFLALGADPRLEGRPMRMYNHALAGFKEPQQVNRLAYLLAMGFEPDLVINLDGFNELALSHQNARSSIHPLHPSGGHWARLMIDPQDGGGASGPAFDALAELRYHQLHAEASAARAIELGLNRFALTTELAAWWLRKLRRQGQEAYDRLLEVGSQEAEELPIYGPGFEEKTPRVLEMAVEAWANTSVAIHGMCQARDIDYLHVLQPTLHDPGSKPLTEQELASSGCSDTWRIAAEQGYPMLRRAGAELTEAGVDFFDASMVFSEETETLYFDACHFVREGQEILARAIAAAYLEHLGPEGPTPPRPSIRTPFSMR